jgi:hypothetical protein
MSTPRRIWSRYLNLGQTFWLPQYPGNKYRWEGKGEASFVEHRLGPQYRGYKVTIGAHQPVVLSPPTADDLCWCGSPVCPESTGLCTKCHDEQSREDMALL